MNDQMPEAKAQALNALTQAASSRPQARQLSATSLRALLDIAWRHQFQIDDRAASRREIRDVVAPEVRRREGTQ